MTDITASFVRENREKLGWTQAELARKANSSQQTVDRIERGETKHSRALTDILNVMQAELEARMRAASASQLPARHPTALFSALPVAAYIFPNFIQREDGGINLAFYSELTADAAQSGAEYSVMIREGECTGQIRPLDTVLVDPNAKLQPKDMVLAFKAHRILQEIGGIVVGTLVEFDAANYYLISNDPDRRTILATADWQVAVIVAKRTNFRPNP